MFGVLDPQCLSTTIKLPNEVEIEVEPMCKNDYPLVRELIPTVSRCSLTHSENDLDEILKLPTFFPFVAKVQKRIIAYAELHTLPHLGRLKDARIERVVVIEEMRGQKVANNLCQFLIQIAKNQLNCGRVELTVETPDAKKVYTNLGFQKVHTEVLRLMF